MAESYLGVRLDSLKRAQNPDGGWGYFPGKRSWLEPTVYAALALAGEPAADRAWELLRGWQGADGSWRPSDGVAVESFGTALCITLALSRGEVTRGAEGASVDKALVDKAMEWLLAMEGTESNLASRLIAKMGWVDFERNVSLRGWPWKPDTSSWVEPTAHALIALKKVAAKGGTWKGRAKLGALVERVRLGEAQLLDIRCHDGGWNYGNREARKVALPSYPETTGIALTGLQGHAGLGAALDYAVREVGTTVSPMGRAWLTIGLRLHDASVPANPTWAPPPDLQILALEALAAPEGNYGALRTEALA